MIKFVHRHLFFTVPSFAGLSDSDRVQKLKELQEAYQQRFSKDFQQKTRESRSSFSSETLEKIDLIHDEILELNTFEIISLRHKVQSLQKSEFDWPIFSRPGVKEIPTEVPGLGPVSSSQDLISKLYEHGRVKETVKDKKDEAEETKTYEKSSYNLVLVGFDPAAKVKFIKCVKDVLGLGLKESKDKVEEVAKGPVVLFKSVSKESHGKVLETLLAAGGKVEFQ